MSRVIDLCSSDEEDDDDEVAFVAMKKPSSSSSSMSKNTTTQQQQLSKNARRRSKPVTPEDYHKLKNNAMETPLSSGCAYAKQKQKKPRAALLFDDSDSDEELLLRPVSFKLRTNNSNKKRTRKSEEDSKPKATVVESEALTTTTTTNLSSKLTASSSSLSSQAKNPPKKAPPTNIYNPYAKHPSRSATTYSDVDNSSLSTAISYPLLPSQTLYEDIRPKLILAFWNHARTLVNASYNLNKLHQMCKRIVALAVSEFPIRSIEEYCRRFSASSPEIVEALKNLHKCSPPPQQTGRYVSIPEACLVALLERVESKRKEDNNTVDNLLDKLPQKEYWVSLSDLLSMIDARLHSASPARLTISNQPDHGAAHYLQSSTRSAEFKQIEKLQSKAYIKSHRLQGNVYYELTGLGYTTAKTIRQRTFPCPKGPYRIGNLCYVEPKFDGICLAVDRREGGGANMRLHDMCNKLDSLKIPYFVMNLNIGDYCLFTNDTTNDTITSNDSITATDNNNHRHRLLPVLVERKSVQDVAASMFDGRWTSQKRRMYQGQYVFGHDNCRLIYIIEGDKSSQELTGGYVGERRFNVTRQQLDEEIENLESEGFEVMRTLSRDHSMVEIARWATRVRQDYADGKLKAQYTYEEFLKQVGKIPRNTDFSKIAKDRAAAANNKLDSPQVVKKPAARRKLDFALVDTKENHNNYNGWSVKDLKDKCEQFGLAKTGKKADLIARLNGPRPPQVWLDRKARNVGYVPSRYNTCATALLVALYLVQKKADPNDWMGMTKEELYPLAESLDISKDPFSGVATGPYKYDGWSSMSDLKQGEIPLVVLKKGRFKLTTTCDVSGYPLAEAMHRWCHEHKVCSCQETGYAFNDEVVHEV